MLLTEWIILVLLFAVAAFAARTLWLVVGADRRRRLLAERCCVLCDVRQGVGISALCPEVDDSSQIAALLDNDYPRYEVVAVIDALLRPEVFRTLLEEYDLMRVDYRMSTELPVTRVRGLYRSRSRSFRRLVLLDRGVSVASDALDAAAGVASYDYLLPVGRGRCLLPHAVERLAAELGEAPAGALRMICTWIGPPAFLIARDDVVEAGGFGGRYAERIPRRAQRTLYEPLFACEALPSARRPLTGVAALLLAAAVAAALWHGLWITASVFLTGAFVWAVVRYTAPYVSPRAPWRAGCMGAVRYLAQKITVKDFTIS